MFHKMELTFGKTVLTFGKMKLTFGKVVLVFLILYLIYYLYSSNVVEKYNYKDGLGNVRVLGLPDCRGNDDCIKTESEYKMACKYGYCTK
jgi:hypothetical protein